MILPVCSASSPSRALLSCKGKAPWILAALSTEPCLPSMASNRLLAHSNWLLLSSHRRGRFLRRWSGSRWSPQSRSWKAFLASNANSQLCMKRVSAKISQWQRLWRRAKMKLRGWLRSCELTVSSALGANLWQPPWKPCRHCQPIMTRRSRHQIPRLLASLAKPPRSFCKQSAKMVIGGCSQSSCANLPSCRQAARAMLRYFCQPVA
mmetsp:Transcript_28574/g.51773  ORF Transcript_28574/g.51773 Transcript_28574/m.51773 type:complete len:207 (-) Transcript_28574:3879-4499(-)